jgi:hypothetical protein
MPVPRGCFGQKAGKCGEKLSILDLEQTESEDEADHRDGF